MSEPLGKRLRAARERKGMTQKDLATCANIAPAMIWRLEDGRAQTTKHLARLATCLGVTADYLAGSSAEEASEGVPVLDWDLVTAVGFVPTVLAQAYDKDDAHRPVGDHYALTVSGSSMAPSLKQGDTLIVESVTDWHPDGHDGYVVAVHDGRAVVREVVRDGAATWLTSLDGRLPAYMVGATNDKVVGVVRALYRSF